MKHTQQPGQKEPATATLVRNLARYDGRTFMGALKITDRRRGKHILRQVVAKDRGGKIIGNFKTQKAALAAIDTAFDRKPFQTGTVKPRPLKAKTEGHARRKTPATNVTVEKRIGKDGKNAASKEAAAE
jgi:hypothetical protein